MKSSLKKNNILQKSIIFAVNQEIMTEGTTTRRYNYIEGGDGIAAVAYSFNGGTPTLCYALTDHQGSICKLVNSAGGTYYSASYDAWGKPTVSTNGINFHRGYTGHEHLSEFNLINMNGRMYDPLLSRFLSPDPFIQMPDFSQNFNRYSYCLNNPMKYTDPDGEWVHLVIGAIIGGVVNWYTHGADFSWKGLGYFGVGAVAGALGAGVGAGISSALSGGSFSAGFMGSSGALTATTSFISGAAIGGGTGVSSGFTTGFGNALVDRKNIGEALTDGLKGGLIGGVSGALLGGLTSGYDAFKNDRNFWNGKLPKADNNEIWGTISLKSSIVPDGELSSDIDSGHSWIELTDVDGNTTSYGTWGYPDANDQTLTALRENYKYDLGRSAEMTKTLQITQSQKARFDYFISKPSNNQWTIFKNCSSFATKAFNYTTGLNVSPHPFLVPISTPAWLVRIY